MILIRIPSIRRYRLCRYLPSSRFMFFEDWYRWNRRTSCLEDHENAITESFYTRPNVSDGILGCDDIGVLRYLAVNGSRSAALFLKDYYSDGPFIEPYLEYKYSCYAALAGDTAMIDDFRSRGQAICPFYPDDLPFIDNAGLRYGVRRSYMISEDTIIASYPTEYSELPEDSRYNAGYRHPDSFGRYRMFCIEGVRPTDLIRYGGLDNIPYGGAGERPWPMNPVVREFSPDELDAVDRRFFRDVRTYFGIGTERDEDAAIVDLLALAEEGNLNAMDMISYAIGYEPVTFLARFPDDDCSGRNMLYRVVADGHMLAGCPEWRLLKMIAGIDEDGTHPGDVFDNEVGGYEDDVMCTTPKNLDGEFIIFKFKPSGYTFGWRGLTFCQSENLSMGEIRRVLRLCIEHLVYGRKIPAGPTKSLISGPMHLYSCSEIEDLREIAMDAPTNLIGWVGTWYRARTFEPSCSDMAEDAAVRMLAKLEDGELWDQVRDCVRDYAEFHGMTEDDKEPGLLCRMINEEDFREEASVFARMNLAERMSALRGIMNDAGVSNPPLILPKRNGMYTITELPEYFDYRADGQMRVHRHRDPRNLDSNAGESVEKQTGVDRHGSEWL